MSHIRRSITSTSDRGDASAQQVDGIASQRAIRPRSIDGRRPTNGTTTLRQCALREVIGDDRGGNRHRQPRPHEHAGHAADRPISQAGALSGRDDDGRVDEHLATRNAANHETRRQRRSGCDEHRRVGTKEHQRAENDDEDRRHDRPIGRGRLLHSQAGDQHRSQNESQPYQDAIGRHRADEARDEHRAGEGAREHRDGGSGRKGWHSGGRGEFDAPIHRVGGEARRTPISMFV